MRCTVCHRFSREVICAACAERLLVPTIRRRTVGTLEVVSLFDYSVIEPFLLTKHTALGHRIYRFFGRHFVAPFVTDYAGRIADWVTVIGVDEHVEHGYAHTALLTHAIRHPHARVLHSTMLAKHRVHYAGKTLQYRLEHPRGFRYTGPADADVILVDDIVTTGITLQEAQQVLRQQRVEVLFALTLADARY